MYLTSLVVHGGYLCGLCASLKRRANEWLISSNRVLTVHDIKLTCKFQYRIDVFELRLNVIFAYVSVTFLYPTCATPFLYKYFVP